MPPRQRRLDESGPEVGQVLVVDGRDWTVEDHSSYSTAEGYAADEWECRGKGALAYLLREDTQPPKWLFTRQIKPGSVTLPGGERLETWLEQNAGATAPDTLVYRTETYRLSETTEGQREASSDDGETKTTWDYWDAFRSFNLAVERWADGTVECYHGGDVTPDTIAVRAAPAQSSPGSWAGWVVIAGFAFAVVALVAEQPIDVSLSAVIAMLVGLVLLGTVFQSAATGWTSVIAVPALWWLFARFPPLTSVPGVLAMIAVPALATRWALMRGGTSARAPLRRAAFVIVAAPVLAAALYHYFWFAPAPRTFGLYLLALGPVAIAGIVAALVSAIVTRISE